MTSRFFLSLTAFSLVCGCPAFADDLLVDEEFVEEEIADASADELEEELPLKTERVSFSRNETSEKTEVIEKQPLPKRLKPHFAGAKRPPSAKTQRSFGSQKIRED
jgi:hypothetical protein